MTRWMDQKYGNGTLAMGSHYQYQQMQQEGRLFNDLNQLQAGDLVFIDTGWQGGAGAELNRAGHVAIYIGNGQILHAANQQAGTIISPISGYQNIIGAAHQSFSGGFGGGFGGGSQSNNPYRVAGRY
jgi:cell wall-associated NlpC family hydrolase